MSEASKGVNGVPAPSGGAPDPLRRRGATTGGKRLKRAGLVAAFVGASSLVAAYAASSLVAPSPSEPSKVASADPKLAAIEAERERASEAVARLEARRLEDDARRAVTERELKALEQRRDALKREVAELAAPLSAPQGEAAPEAPPQETEAAEPAEPPAENVAEAPADEIGEAPQPQEDQRSSAVVAAVPNDADEPARSSASVDAPLRVFIHVRASDRRAIARARAVAAELEREGVAVAGIRGVPFAVREDAMRYFYDADRASLGALSRAVEGAGGAAPRAQDYRRYGAPPRRGTVELWLS